MEEKAKGISEDWLSLWLGLTIFVLSLFTFSGADILGWGINTKVWTNVSQALAPISKNYAGLSGFAALVLTYLFLLVLMTIGAKLLGARIGRFIASFTLVFWIGYGCWLAGHYAYIAATPDKLKAFGIGWSLNLTGEAGFIVALLAGLIVGNFFPQLAEFMKEATRPELYIKTAIVIMGAGLGVKAASSMGLASAVMFRGLCAIVEAYLIYWALVYWMARKYFGFSREWAAPLASGISICGVSAAIATGGAIRSRPIVPIMVSSLVVIFAVVELLILPYLAKIALWKEPLVAGAWMGLAVKTDGAAVASGAITDSWVRAQALAQSGINYKDGWMLMTATTVKMFIDIFIGVWAFILAYIWCAKIECKPGEKVGIGEIWKRFPKFVIGYALTFFILLFICWPAYKATGAVNDQIASQQKQAAAAEAQMAVTADTAQKAALETRAAEARAKVDDLNKQLTGPNATIAAAKLSTSEGNIPRVMFFVLTFFTIGLVSNFKKLWEEGIGKLAAVYLIALFGFIIWIGLFISWIFFHGVKPPLAG